MARSYIKNESGKVTGVRETSKDGRKSWTYEPDNSISGSLFGNGKGKCVDVTDHHKDGNSTSYEPDNSILGSLFGGGKGKRK